MKTEKWHTAIKEANTKHGLIKCHVYEIWCGIKKRCYNLSDPAFFDYGGRGIKVHKPWVDDFMSFYCYVTFLPGYCEILSLDRTINNGDYEPGNLRWVTRSIQGANRRIKKTNTSGYSGIHRYKQNGKWQARISIGGRRISLGYYKTIEDAVSARNKYIIDNNLYRYQIQ